MKPIIVIPTFNEGENIEKLIKKIFQINISNLEIIVVDDNSPDGTADIVKQLRETYPIHVIERPEKRGLGSAYIAGFKKAIELDATHMLEMDADFSHDPEDLPQIIAAAQTYDLVIGSRKIQGGKIIGWGFVRKSMSNGAMWFSRILLGLQTKDVTAGFRCYKKQVLESIELETIKSNGYAFQEEMLFRTEQKKFSVKEIPVTFVDRQEGKSKLSKKDIIEFFFIILKLRKQKK